MTGKDEGLKRFTALVAAYGARPGAWPEAERAWAQALMAASPAARRLAEEAAEIDGWLDFYAAPPTSAALEARVLAAAPVHAPAIARPARQEWPPLLAALWARLRRASAARLLHAPMMRPVYATACAALIGLVLGWGGVFADTASEEEEMLAMAFIGDGLEQYELGE